MSAIITADVHWNSKPTDDYRWGLLDWLAEQAADELVIAGDLTDAKDHHPAKLVNRLHSGIARLKRKFKIVIIRGNHDYYSVEHPFFEFLRDGEDVVFVTEPVRIDLTVGSAFFVPAGVSWDFEVPVVDYLFTHATFSGAKAENGTTLTGVDPRVLGDFAGEVYSGDIHVPQMLDRGRIKYVGAPYHVRFGDEFDPRLVRLADGGAASDLRFPAPRKHTFRIIEPGDLLEERAARGDHVKVKCLLRRADYDRWRGYHAKIRKIAEDRGWLLFGAEPVAVEMMKQPGRDGDPTAAAVPPDELVAAYVTRHKASDEYLEAGRQLLVE